MTGDGGSLRGLRVLDLTQFLSGPFGTQILGDLGAEIIKVEGPDGDSSRHVPPHFVGEDSVYFLSANRNKRSLCLDLKTAEGLDLLKGLISRCDVVIENFKPGTLERLGLSPNDIQKEQPSLIWCSISGFGQDGPYRERPAYDMVVQAISGGMSLTGEPGGRSVRAGIPLADLAAGMYAVIGILSAVVNRTKTGDGNIIDISMLDCQAAMLSYQASYFLHSGIVPGHQGTGHDSIPTYRVFTAADGVELVVTANTERMWKGMCRALGCEALIDDDRFATNSLRFANRDTLWPILESAFASAPSTELTEALHYHGVPIGIINTLDRVVDDPQIKSRGMVVEMAATDGSRVRAMGNPVRMAGSSTAYNYPPAIGEHSAEILIDLLGLTRVEIEELRDKGIVS